MPEFHRHLVDHPSERLAGKAPALAALRAQIRHLAVFDNLGSPHVPTVLLQGETGTGKGLVARVIHDSGPRARGPFIEVNCAAIPETMLEAELFGFEAGAFTDAKRTKSGLFEAASRGTLLLDEVDALPLVLQGKLLTALESKRVRRLGAVTERAVDVKVIAATNAVLPEAVAAGRFRADLYHRLAVVVLVLPPLRELGEDILVLAQTYLQHYTAAHGVPPKRLNAEAETWLQGYAWPGNVRELIHVMERVTLLHLGEEVDAKTLMQLCQLLTAPAVRAKAVPAPQEVAGERAVPPEGEEIRRTLVQTGGNVARAARLLGLSRDTVRYRMQRYGIERPRLGVPSPSALPPAPSGLPTPLLSSEEMKPPQDSAARPDTWTGEPMEHNVQTPEPAWEHKPVAVLALQLTWPTASGFESRRYDPWTEMARWEQAIADKVHGFGGALVQRTGSRLIWLFGVPEVLEQLPQRAVHSALAIRQMIVEASAPDLPSRPTVCLAVHLGAVRVDPQAADPVAHVRAVGDTLALPMRLLGQAEPGEIVVSPEVGRSVDGWVALEARPLRLRTEDPARVGGYVVVGVSPGREAWAGHRRLSRSPFVGRERELTLLEALLEQVKAGLGQVVSLVGMPGMGKSRLLAEFRQRLSGQRITHAEGRCLAYGSGMPYLPVLDLLREYCGIAADDPPETLRTKVRSSLQQASLDAETSLPDLLQLLGVPDDADSLEPLTTEARRARMFEAVRQLFLGSSQHHPVVLVVEDLHWIDPSSEALLASLVDGLAGAAMLLLTTCRPGYRAPWLDKSYATQIALHPLDPDDSRQVVRRVLHDTVLPLAVEQQLLARAEGNPFFLEELAYTIREHGEGGSALAVPDTIQAVLAARMDRLPIPERQLLQTASVIGKDMAFPLLQAIAGHSEATLERSLAHLQAGEFLYQTQLFPERAYTFKHALTHEVAYASLIQDWRRALHARLVEAIEALAPDRLSEQIDLLAHHALRGEVWEKAFTYFRQAGTMAATRSANREAVLYFEQALEALRHVPDSRAVCEQAIDLRLDLRGPLARLGEFGRVLDHLQEAETLAEALGSQSRLAYVSSYQADYLRLMGSYDRALAAGQRAFTLVPACGDVRLQAMTTEHLGVIYYSLGSYQRAMDCFRESMASLESEPLRERFGMAVPDAIESRTRLLLCLAEVGAFAEGVTIGEEGIRIAEAINHPLSLARAYYGLGFVALRQGDLHHAIARLERGLALCHTWSIRDWFVAVAAALGDAYAMAGRLAEALPLLEQAVEQNAMPRRHLASLWITRLSQGYVLAGRLANVMPLARQALDLARDGGERGCEAYALRLLGEMYAHLDALDAEQAEAYYRQALALAEKLGMRPLVAHCHLGLGTLYRQIGRAEEACAAASTALELYRAMEMTFWLPQAEAALAPVTAAPAPRAG